MVINQPVTGGGHHLVCTVRVLKSWPGAAKEYTWKPSAYTKMCVYHWFVDKKLGGYSPYVERVSKQFWVTVPFNAFSIIPNQWYQHPLGLLIVGKEHVIKCGGIQYEKTYVNILILDHPAIRSPFVLDPNRINLSHNPPVRKCVNQRFTIRICIYNYIYTHIDPFTDPK